jgi:AraC-like DNA-binding protein
MMLLERLPPSPSLRSLVSGFEERSAHFGQTSLTHPLPARPDLFIEIYLAQPYRVSHQRQDFETSPEVALVGPHGVGTTRLLMAGEIKAFSIRFQPGAIHRLIRLDMNSIANHGVAMADVFGRVTSGLRDAVLGAADFPNRAAAAERWLGYMLREARPIDRIDIAAKMLLESGGQKRIDALAGWAGLSERQFTRRFAAQVGLNPKLYARAVRLNAALKARQSRPEATWTELAHDTGYADQAHFVRECRELTDSSPSAFFAEWTRIPST